MTSWWGKLVKGSKPDVQEHAHSTASTPATAPTPDSGQSQSTGTQTPKSDKHDKHGKHDKDKVTSKWSSAFSSGPTSRKNPPQQKQQPEPKSAFHASAAAAARAGLHWPERTIDETTDLSTLTDQEITRLMEGMEGDMLSQPLITGPVPLLAIRQEYISGGSPQVLRKIEWLEGHGWDQVWRARGDGDCFYRSFTLAYLLRIMYAPDPSRDASRALQTIHAQMPLMARVGFQVDLLEEFMDPLIQAVAGFIDPPVGQEPTEYSLLQLLQDTEKSNCIVVALRLITGAYIRVHPDDFAPFLFSPSTLQPMDPDAFCREEVEPCGKEADHAQIMALAAALHMPLRVAYLDRSDVGDSGDVINWVVFGEQSKGGERDRPLTLLYRPGHFDVVTRDKLMEAALAQSQQELGRSPRHSASDSQQAPDHQAVPSASAGGPSGSRRLTEESQAGSSQAGSSKSAGKGKAPSPPQEAEPTQPAAATSPPSQVFGGVPLAFIQPRSTPASPTQSSAPTSPLRQSSQASPTRPDQPAPSAVASATPIGTRGPSASAPPPPPRPAAVPVLDPTSTATAAPVPQVTPVAHQAYSVPEVAEAPSAPITAAPSAYPAPAPEHAVEPSGAAVGPTPTAAAHIPEPVVTAANEATVTSPAPAAPVPVDATPTFTATAPPVPPAEAAQVPPSTAAIGSGGHSISGPTPTATTAGFGPDPTETGSAPHPPQETSA